MKVLITGANGFVGRALCEDALFRGYDVHGSSRTVTNLPNGVECVALGDINGNTDWFPALSGCDVVIHLAARVHVISEFLDDSLFEFRKVNVIGTEHLARSAVACGVKRFIYISSIKVNGELTCGERKFFADDNPRPEDSYAISKLEAEIALKKLAKDTGLEVVIIRPPLIYGRKVKANFASMMNWLYKEIPLPFGAVKNRRSLVSLDNLVDLIFTCIDHPNAANQTFLVSDDHDVSTTTLLSTMSTALGKRSWLIPIPVFILRALFFLFGRKNLSQRLLGSLRVDITKTKKLLDWKPPGSFEEGILQTAHDFLNNRFSNN